MRSMENMRRACNVWQNIRNLFLPIWRFLSNAHARHALQSRAIRRIARKGINMLSSSTIDVKVSKKKKYNCTFDIENFEPKFVSFRALPTQV